MSDVRIEIPDLHSAQAAVKAGARRFSVLVCGRRWGKTLLCDELILDTLLAGMPVAYATPTYKMLSDVWRDVVELLKPITKTRSEQERRLETVTGGVLDMWSLDAPDAIRGRAYARFIIDEAASVRSLEEVWNSVIRPTLVDFRGDAWFPSTPKGMNGFYKLNLIGKSGDKEWGTWHFTSYDNPYLDPAELDAMRATMTERDYRQEILAEFLEGEGQVFRGIEASTLAPMTSPGEHEGHTLIAGVDWGKDVDFTAISVGCAGCKREVELVRFNQVDYAFQRQRLMGLLKKWGVVHTVVEANSIGTPILEQLQRDGVRVSGFTTTMATKMGLIEDLSLAIEQGSVQLLGDAVGKAELEAYERSVTETGLSKYGAPAGMHDDTVIARALMWRAMQRAPRTARVGTSEYERVLNRLRKAGKI